MAKQSSFILLITPSNLLPMLTLQHPLFNPIILPQILLPQPITRPDPLNTKLKRPGHPINQANPHRPHLLPQQLRLRLNHNPVVRPHKFVPLDQHRLPLARPPRIQSMLMQIRRHNTLRLDIDEVLAAVGLYAEREEGVRVDVP